MRPCLQVGVAADIRLGDPEGARLPYHRADLALLIRQKLSVPLDVLLRPRLDLPDGAFRLGRRGVDLAPGSLSRRSGFGKSETLRGAVGIVGYSVSASVLVEFVSDGFFLSPMRNSSIFPTSSSVTFPF